MPPKMFLFTLLFHITPPYVSPLPIYVLLFLFPSYATLCLYLSFHIFPNIFHIFSILPIPSNAYLCLYVPIGAPLCIFWWLYNNSTITLYKNIARQSPCTTILLQPCPFKISSRLPIKCVINKNSACSA